MHPHSSLNRSKRSRVGAQLAFLLFSAFLLVVSTRAHAQATSSDREVAASEEHSRFSVGAGVGLRLAAMALTHPETRNVHHNRCGRAAQYRVRQCCRGSVLGSENDGHAVVVGAVLDQV